MKKLVMWDIDHTLLRSGEAGLRAWQTAFSTVTGVAWVHTPAFGGRTDLDLVAEVFSVHGVTDCTPEAFFATYIDHVHASQHLIAEQGTLMPGVRAVLDRLAADPDIVQTLVTGNVPQVARAKVAAFGLADVFDTEVGGYGTDDRVRATLVRRSLERAEAKYGQRFQPVVVGDTAHDVTGALANDAIAVAVATGSVSMADLALAGAHAVLPDLSDVDAACAAISGRGR